jgi:hypothetical protein
MIALPITATISPRGNEQCGHRGSPTSWAFCLREGRSSSRHFDRAVALFVARCPAISWRGALGPSASAVRSTATPTDLRLFQDRWGWRG